MPVSSPGAFAGLRVLDLAGPIGVYAARLLAGFGADVIRVEPPGGESIRRRAPFFRDRPGLESSLQHWHFNAGKRGIVLDLRTKSGRAAFEDLVKNADVLFTSFPARELDEFGLSFPVLKGLNSSLIAVSITPFGLSGPRSGWKGGDLIGAAASGVASISGVAGGVPYQPGAEQAFHQAGLVASVSALVAIEARRKDGRGRLVDVSMQEALAIGVEAGVGTADLEGKVRPRRSTLASTTLASPTRALDGWVAGPPGTRWDARIEWLEREGFLTSAEANVWRNPAVRAGRGTAELDRLTAAMLESLPKETIYHEAQRRRMPMGPVRRVSELFRDRQLIARNFFDPFPIPLRSVTPPAASAPFQLSRTPWRLERSAPDLDEHNGGSWKDNRTFAPGAEADSPCGRPLAGIRIVDFTVHGAGPVATRLLASMGAEVIKVESQEHPDGVRFVPFPKPPGSSGVNVNGIYNNFNTDKLGITVELESPEGRDLLGTLLSISDVVVDNFGRDPFPRWGVDYESLAARYPDLIVARSSTVGRSGPDREYTGFGFGIAATAGLNLLTGFPDEAPIGAGALPDFTCNPHHLVAAILAALEYRRRTGLGQLVDLSQVESTIAFLGPALLDYQLNGRDSIQPRNRSLYMAPHGIFRCAGDDRWIAIEVEDDAAWKRFCEVAEHPEWHSQHRFSSPAARKMHEDELDSLIAGWTLTGNDVELAERLQAAGVAAAPVQTNLDLLTADAHLQERGYFKWVEHPELGRHAVDGLPFVVEPPVETAWRASPRLGEDNETVFRELLGLGEDRIASLNVESIVVR